MLLEFLDAMIASLECGYVYESKSKRESIQISQFLVNPILRELKIANIGRNFVFFNFETK